MRITRKDFLSRSGVALVPISLAGAGAAPAATAGESPPSTAGLSHFNVRQFGAKGDGQSKDTTAIQAAIDAAGTAGGTVCLPAGKYVSGTLRLKSRVAVYLDAGATLIASPDKDDFDPYEKLDYQSHADQETTDFHYALLRGQDVEHVTVAGPGMIDGNRSRRGGPKPLAFKNCRHIAIRDITLKNSPNYNISLLGCDFVDIDGVTILNGYCDGIDPDCSHHVRIANCFVESWDDAICPKASFALGYRRSTENVTVTNCVLTTACNAIKLGTESSGDFKNVAISNCAIFARVDLWKRPPTSGVSIEMVDGGSLERIAVSNLVMADVRAPIFVRFGNRGRAQPVPTPGLLEHLSLADICATGASLASSITGIPGYPVRRITLWNVQIAARGGGATELAHKEVPELESKYPEAGMFGELPAYGLFCRHVENLVLDHVDFHLEKPDGRPALLMDQGSQIDLRSVLADPPAGEEPVIWLRQVRDCLAQGIRARPGTKTCFKVSGARTAGIRAVGSDFSEGQQAVLLDKEVNASVWQQSGNLLRPQ
ncbi:MAG: right-handed parallel beta-helix repeat-containing protein [Chloroflexi bacterium]|nr:right-handed parallel beta-helix repeat-containing protein [Chloroflexota bacterium]